MKHAHRYRLIHSFSSFFTQQVFVEHLLWAAAGAEPGSLYPWGRETWGPGGLGAQGGGLRYLEIVLQERMMCSLSTGRRAPTRPGQCVDTFFSPSTLCTAQGVAQ